MGMDKVQGNRSSKRCTNGKRKFKEREEWQTGQKPKAGHRHWFIRSQTQGSQSSCQ